MSKCEAGSGVVERSLKLWRLIIERVQCGRGGGGVERRKKAVGSERLSELLKQAEHWWENEEVEEVRRKEEVLEALKRVAKKLQGWGCSGSMEVLLEGTAEVRRLAKDDPNARTTLALLGVIPPLVGLLDTPDPPTLLIPSALYALLNLSISNHASVLFPNHLLFINLLHSRSYT